jgi:hypothetical protein
MARKNPLHRSLGELMDGSFVDLRRQWHPVFKVLLFVVVIFVVLLVLRFVFIHA